MFTVGQTFVGADRVTVRVTDTSTDSSCDGEAVDQTSIPQQGRRIVCYHISLLMPTHRPAGTTALSRRITDSLNTQSRKVILCLRHQQLHHQAQTHFTSTQWDMSSIVNSVIYEGDFCSAFPPTSFNRPLFCSGIDSMHILWWGGDA